MTTSKAARVAGDGRAAVVPTWRPYNRDEAAASAAVPDAKDWFVLARSRHPVRAVLASVEASAAAALSFIQNGGAR